MRTRTKATNAQFRLRLPYKEMFHGKGITEINPTILKKMAGTHIQ